jgi:hypothetical protein
MGCTSGREVGAEESLILYAESGLNFTAIDVETLDITFRKYHCNGIMNQSQLIQISQQLNFPILNVNEHRNIQKFYNSLKQKEGYPLKDLLLISILLGKGKLNKKARLIYEIFDEHFSHQLEYEIVKNEIVYRMLNHCVNTLPLLVYDRFLEADVRSKLERRIRKLNEVIPFACEHLAKQFCIRGNVISVGTFVEVLCEQPKLVSPMGIRRYLEESRILFKQSSLESKEIHNGRQ